MDQIFGELVVNKRLRLIDLLTIIQFTIFQPTASSNITNHIVFSFCRPAFYYCGNSEIESNFGDLKIQ